MFDAAKRKTLLSGFLLALAFTGCDLSDAPAEAGAKAIQPPLFDTADGVTTALRIRYRIDGDTLRMKPDPAIVLVRCYEDDSTPHRSTDTTSRSLAWKIYGDTLRFHVFKDTVADAGGFGDTLVVERWNALVRTSGSSGLAGSWRSVGWGGRVLSGRAPEGFFQPDSLQSLLQTLFVVVYTFDGQYLKMSTLKRSAQYYLADWAGKFEGIPYSDSVTHDIEAIALDGRHVRMTGRRSGEIVDIRWSDSAMTYTSSEASHAPYVRDVVPKTCPSSDTPRWWWEFLRANRHEPSARPSEPAPRAARIPVGAGLPPGALGSGW